MIAGALAGRRDWLEPRGGRAAAVLLRHRTQPESEVVDTPEAAGAAAGSSAEGRAQGDRANAPPQDRRRWRGALARGREPRPTAAAERMAERVSEAGHASERLPGPADGASRSRDAGGRRPRPAVRPGRRVWSRRRPGRAAEGRGGADHAADRPRRAGDDQVAEDVCAARTDSEARRRRTSAHSRTLCCESARSSRTIPRSRRWTATP